MDTAAFLALIDRNDSLHQRSVAVLERLRIRRYRLITTKYVIYESYAGILTGVGGDEARRFLEGMANSATRLVRVGGRDEQRAKEILFHYRDKEYSLCDATSFAIMERLGLTLAFTFDDHFRQHGFSTPLDYDDWP